MNMDFTEEFLKESCTKILNDPACGKVFRIKGFQKLSDGSWISLNVTHQKTEIQPISKWSGNLNRHWRRTEPASIEGIGKVKYLILFS